MSNPKFTKNITKVNPTDLVNDQNANAAPCELQENVEYILNFLNGNKALLSGVFGNLWDYNQDGRRTLYNGGKFDTFKKANAWTSLTELRVSNEDEISFDEDNEIMVYKGWSTKTQRREKWIEKEVYIPEPLRDQQLVFSFKASGSTQNEDWSTENAVFETVAVQILGAEEDIQEFRTVGKWTNHDYYTNDSFLPEMLTNHIFFRVSNTTESVKIKIYRTKDEDYLHIDSVYVGGLATPYDNDIEEYQLEKIDINELYDFDNGVTKVISTAVMGHKVPESFDEHKASDLVTFEHLNRFLQNWVTSSVCNFGIVNGVVLLDENSTSRVYTISDENIGADDVPNVTLVVPDSPKDYENELDRQFFTLATGVSGVSALSVVFDEEECYTVDDYLNALEKYEGCDSENFNGLVANVTGSDTSGNNLFVIGEYRDVLVTDNPVRIMGINNIVEGSFNVILSDSPDVSGYKIRWSIPDKVVCSTPSTTGTTGTSGTSGTSGTPTLGNYFFPQNALDAIEVPDEDAPTASGDVAIFDYTSE